MTVIRVINQTRGTILGDRVRLADDLPSRSRGFLFRPPPADGEGILLSPCRAVHMYGVRFPLDIVFISETGQVVATYRELRPWRRSSLHGTALHALELPPGTIRATDTVVGDVLSWTAANGEPASLEAVESIPPDAADRAGAESSDRQRRHA
jgi:uncharacterized protein